MLNNVGLRFNDTELCDSIFLYKQPMGLHVFRWLLYVGLKQQLTNSAEVDRRVKLQ